LIGWRFLREGGAGGFSELLDEFQRQRATGAFVTVDRGSHEYEIRADEVANKGKWDCGGFVNYDEFGLSKYMGVLRLDILSYGPTVRNHKNLGRCQRKHT
jgi:hypothetical protein